MLDVTESKKRADKINIAFGNNNITLEQAIKEYSEWLSTINSIEELLAFSLLLDTFVHLARLLPPPPD